MDEIFSYELSNSAFEAMVNWEEDFLNTWHEGNYYRQRLVVDEETAYNYTKVYSNQEQDVHPPLFYFLLHTVCSFFPNTYSKWYGIGLNLIFFVLTQIVLYLFSVQILQDKKKALIPIILYGFSAGAISCAIFVRMYMMMTFFAVCFVWINYSLWTKPQKKTLVMLACVFFLGLFTQYYFIIFAFFISCIYFFANIFLKKNKDAALYALVMFSTIALNILIYPAMLDHIFSGYRGQQALDNLASQELGHNIKTYIEIMDKGIFGGFFEVAILVLVGYLLVQYFGRKIKKIYYSELERKVHIDFYCIERKKNISIQLETIMCMFLLLAIAFYVLMIVKIAPYQEDRYVFCVYPLCILAMYCLLEKIILEKMKSAKNNRIVVVSAMILLTIIGYANGNVNYLYLGAAEQIQTLEMYREIPVIYFSENNKKWKVTGDMFLLAEMNQIYTTTDAGLEEISEYIKESEFPEIVVFINEGYNGEDIIAEMMSIAEYDNYEFLFKHKYSNIYHCYD